MSAVLTGFFVLGALIAVGYLAGRLRIGGPTAAHVLTQFTFYIANPALLFTVLADAELTMVWAYLPTTLATALTTGLLYTAASLTWFRRPAGPTIIGAMSSSFVNANYLGVPIAIYALGSATPIVPILLIQLLLIAPLCLTALDLTSGATVSVQRVLLQPVRNPVIVAALLGAGCAFFNLPIPQLMLEPLLLLGGAAIPLVLIAFGMSLRGDPPLVQKSHRIEVLVATACKSILMPIIAFILGTFIFQLDSRAVFELTILSALPTAQNVFLFASQYKQGTTIARDTALTSTALAVPGLLAVTALLA